MFDDRLKKLRLEKNLNMKQVSIALGMPYTTYVGYEKNEREPNSEALVLIANFFDCSIDYLIGRSNSRKLTTTRAFSPTNKLSKIIYERRSELGLSIEELAEAIDVSESKVKSWENGIAKLQNMKQINKLAEVLQIDPIELLPESDSPFTEKVADSADEFQIYTKKEKLLLNNYKVLNSTGKEKLIDYSDDLVSNGKYTEKQTK